MTSIFRRAGLALALAAATCMAVPAAQAQDRYRRGGGGGDDAAIAIGAGIVGLAIGAAIASDGRRDRRYYRGDYERPRFRDGYNYDGYYRDRPSRYHAKRYKRRYRDSYRNRDYYRGRDRYYDRSW